MRDHKNDNEICLFKFYSNFIDLKRCIFCAKCLFCICSIVADFVSDRKSNLCCRNSRICCALLGACLWSLRVRWALDGAIWTYNNGNILKINDILVVFFFFRKKDTCYLRWHLQVKASLNEDVQYGRAQVVGKLIRVRIWIRIHSAQIVGRIERQLLYEERILQHRCGYLTKLLKMARRFLIRILNENLRYV